jgi:hypothetical protein
MRRHHRDRTTAFFDRAKDIFRYLLDMEKHWGGKSCDGVTAVYVTGCCSACLVDAREVPLVTGSRGPWAGNRYL